MASLPRISVIMPTRNRGTFLRQAIKLYRAQDYPNKELIIFEDGDECNWEMALGLNYHFIPGHLSIGEKRNRAVEMARGEIICHQDDDDWFSPERLSLQVAPILAGHADITALSMSHLLNTQDGTLWECSEDIHRTLFPYNVRCSTLMYKASYWHEGVHYEDTSHGEDSHFMASLLEHGARLERLVVPLSYICVRHGKNTTDALAGMKIPGWQQVPIEYYIPEDERVFYAQLRQTYLNSCFLKMI